MEDLIERARAIEIIHELQDSQTFDQTADMAYDLVDWAISEIPSAQPEKRTEERTETHACDLISRQEAIDATWFEPSYTDPLNVLTEVRDKIKVLPSVQPERTCVNCGRTVNNGGWYADGSTRCPIEEHYALPKDGYCHLWEKRNVTDDDYPERREE